jgi:hypothetical protein
VRTIRRLPIVVAPIIGESFASYVTRLAADIGTDLLAVMHATGLVDTERKNAIPRGYGVYLHAHRLQSFAHAVGEPSDRISAMLLGRFDGIAVDLSDLTPDNPDTGRRVARREWVFFIGSHVCPECIAENGAWRLAWKLPWSFACVKHRRLLVDRCPRCGNQPGGERSTGGVRSGLEPALVGIVPQPHCCSHSCVRSVVPGAGQPCGELLTNVRSDRLPADSTAVVAQATIDQLLSPTSNDLLCAHVAALPYFRNLRSICAFLMHVLEPADFPDVPPSTLAALVEHVASRHVSSTRSGKTRSRLRYFTRVPRNAALMAALVPRALEILESRDDELLEHVSRLADQALRLRTTGEARILGRSVFLPPPILAMYEAKLDDVMQFAFRLPRQVGSLDRWSFGPDHVPQLFWPDTSRRFCSLALVKLVAGTTWKHAARSLGMPDIFWSPGLVRNLNRNGTADEFVKRLRAFADGYEHAPRINYGERRRSLASLSQIPRRDWPRILGCAHLEPSHHDDTRRMFGAIWLWAELTMGDWRLAPATPDSGAIFAQRYRKIVERGLEPLKPALVTYGQSLLATGFSI